MPIEANLLHVAAALVLLGSPLLAKLERKHRSLLSITSPKVSSKLTLRIPRRLKNGPASTRTKLFKLRRTRAAITAREIFGT